MNAKMGTHTSFTSEEGDMTNRVIKTARPNGWAIRLSQYEGNEYVLEEADEDGYWYDAGEWDTLEEAEREFEARVKVLRTVPNWELQARYDEEHGTDNGYPRWNTREEF